MSSKKIKSTDVFHRSYNPSIKDYDHNIYKKPFIFSFDQRLKLGKIKMEQDVPLSFFQVQDFYFCQVRIKDLTSFKTEEKPHLKAYHDVIKINNMNITGCGTYSPKSRTVTLFHHDQFFMIKNLEMNNIMTEIIFPVSETPLDHETLFQMNKNFLKYANKMISHYHDSCKKIQDQFYKLCLYSNEKGLTQSPQMFNFLHLQELEEMKQSHEILLQKIASKYVKHGYENKDSILKIPENWGILINRDKIEPLDLHEPVYSNDHENLKLLKKLISDN